MSLTPLVGLVAVGALSLVACSGEDRAVEVEPSFDVDSEGARQLVVAIEELMASDSFIVTVVIEPPPDDGQQSVRMVYDAPDRASVETTRSGGEETLEFIDGPSILRPSGDEGQYLRYEIDVSGVEVEGTQLEDVDLNVAELLFSPLRKILEATEIERQGDDLVLTAGSGDPIRARLDDDGRLVEVVLIAPESRAEQIFTFSELDSADPIDLPEDVIDFDDLPDCDEPRPISEAGPCRG